MDLDFRDFNPQSKAEALAYELAEGLNDFSNLKFYVWCTRQYPESFLRGIYDTVKETPDHHIKKSRGAYFHWLVKRYLVEGNRGGVSNIQAR